MASSCEELLMCPNCLVKYTELVTTPCGHNYCKACITEHLSSTDEPVCPLCKEALQTQSELKVNTALQNLVQHFSNITVRSDGETPAEAWEVTCDTCCEPKLKVQWLCLKCGASYCQHHLEQHQREATFKKHQLVEEKKALLVRVVSKIKAKEASQRSRMEELKCSVEQSRREWEKEVEEIDQAWNSLAACVQRGQTELAELRQQRQKAAQVKNDRLVASLEQDVAKLKSKQGELELVLQKGDQMYLLQNFTSLSKVPGATRGQFHSSLNNDVKLVKNSVERMQAKLSEEMEKLKNNILLSPP